MYAIEVHYSAIYLNRFGIRHNKPGSLKITLYRYQTNLMLANSPANTLTEFLPNLQARVFVLMQTALPIEAEDYGLLKKGKTEK